MNHRTAAIVTALGGALMVIGSFMPWITARTGFGSLDVAGTTGDGVFTLILGALIGLGAVVSLDRPASGLARGGIITAGMIGFLLGLFEWSNVNQRIADITTDVVAASVGPGIYLLLIGAATVVAGGFRMHAVRTLRQSGDFDWSEEDARRRALKSPPTQPPSNE